jgi:Flp pilus assembly protein TadG
MRAAIARLLHDDHGVVSLEYAIVLPFFMAIMFAIFQLSFAFITQELMDSAASDVARQIRIGTLTGSSSSYSTNLVAAVCNDLSVTGYQWVPSCTANIQIYVAAASSGSPAGTGFTGLTTASVSNNTMNQSKASLQPKYDVILQIGYNRPWIASGFTGNSMLISTLAFQTEPY